MKRKLLLLSAIVPLLLTSCEKEDSYFKQFSVSNITSDTGRVRVVDSIYGTVSPFDTQILLQLYSSPSNAITFSQDFDFLIKKYHALFDRYYSYTIDGEKINNVKTFNDSYGTNEAIKVDDILFETLKEAIEFTKETNGLFNIASGKLATLWANQITQAKSSDSYSQESYAAGRLIYHDPADDVIQKATTCTPSADIIDEVLVLDSKNKTVTFKSFGGCDGKDNKAELTFGAVGKGRAVDLFIDNYSDYSILINAGQSSVKTNKFKKGQEPWSLEIANPKFNEKMSILFDSYLVGSYFKVNSAEVYFRKGGNFNFSTSGYYNNYYQSYQTGKIRSHIVNPQTGYSETTFDAVSVFTDNSTYGDMYSTALTNTKSIDEAQELLAKLNKKFKQNAVAFYIVKEGEKEIYYVPDSLKDVLQVKDKKKYNLNYDIVSEIRVIGE